MVQSTVALLVALLLLQPLLLYLKIDDCLLPAFNVLKNKQKNGRAKAGMDAAFRSCRIPIHTTCQPSDSAPAWQSGTPIL